MAEDPPKDEAKVAPPDPEDEHEPMEFWERFGSVAIGVVLLEAGLFAVFISDNQAGTAVLLVAAAAFLLIGIQGTPLLKFGNNTVELARRRKRVAIAIEVAKREENPDV